MKIALFCSSRNKIPSNKTGGTEQPIFYLAKELAKRKHRVTLYAAKGSEVPGVEVKEISTVVVGTKRKHILEQEHLANYFDLIALADFFKYDANSFDVIQFNNYKFYEILPFVRKTKVPVIIRINYPYKFIYPYIKKSLKAYSNNIYYLPISYFVKSLMSGLNYLRPIYPAIDLEDFKFSRKSKGYLLFMGRICHNKGVHTAIKVAKLAKKKLVIAGRIDEDQPYFDYYLKFVKPHINNRTIKYVGEVDFATKVKLFQGALATLFPIDWDEPFGNVQIESMACGTPVITFNRAASHEVINNGKSGYIVGNQDVNKMVEAIKKVHLVDRVKTRQWVKNNFSIQILVKEYEKIYKDLRN